MHASRPPRGDIPNDRGRPGAPVRPDDARPQRDGLRRRRGAGRVRRRAAPQSGVRQAAARLRRGAAGRGPYYKMRFLEGELSVPRRRRARVLREVGAGPRAPGAPPLPDSGKAPGAAPLRAGRPVGATEECMLVVQGNLANSYKVLGRIEEALNLYRDVYSEELKLYGRHNKQTLESASNYAMTLLDLERFEEAKILLHKVAPVAQRVCGAEHDLTLSLREDLSRAILDGESSAEEKREALQMLEDTVAVMRRVFGPAHPETLRAQRQLEHYRGSH